MRPFDQLTSRGQAVRLRQLAASLLPAYGLGGGRLTLINREFNTTFRVDLPTRAADHPPYVAGRYLLRIHQRDHHDPRLDRQQVIESELAWLAALRADTTISVPEPVLTNSGTVVLTTEISGVGARFCSLLRWLDGRIQFAHAVPRHLYLVGALMAQLHNHAASWRLPLGFARVRWDWHAFFGGYAIHRRVPDEQIHALDLFIAARETVIALWVAATAEVNPGFGVALEAELAPNAQAVAQLLR
jgi:Ser/Thr protein kinase RdoA (MazF antagonist)